jgi:dTDP-glucose 4,6-dehydratase
MSETYLVTGGAGFIGSNLVHLLHRNRSDIRIVVLDKLTYAADPKQLEGLDRVNLVVGDIQDLELVRNIIEQNCVTKIFHLAAESHVDRSITGPAAFIQTNVVGTFSMLEAARQVWAGQKDCRFLHISTDEVYGSLGEVGKFHEDMAYAPNSPYSASKAGSDHLVRAYHCTYGLNTVTTNCSNNYGPRQHSEKLIPLAVLRAAKGLSIPVYGDGQNVRDWLYVSDHCKALETIMLKGKSGETYCIGGENEWKNIDLLNLICDNVDQYLGREIGISRNLLMYVEDRAGHDRRYSIDSSKVQSEIGWKASTKFNIGIKQTIDWYLSSI